MGRKRQKLVDARKGAAAALLVEVAEPKVWE